MDSLNQSYLDSKESYGFKCARLLWDKERTMHAFDTQFRLLLCFSFQVCVNLKKFCILENCSVLYYFIDFYRFSKERIL